MCASGGSGPAGAKRLREVQVRQVGLCTPVSAALPSLLGAIWPCTVGTGCIVRADLDSKMPFGAPKWPSELQLGPPSRTPSSTWRFLGRFLVLLQPSESSSRLDESSILMVQAFLQSKRSWTAISHLFGLNLDLLDASWAQLGASWAPLGLNLEPLGRLLDSTWSLLGASWAPLGAY